MRKYRKIIISNNTEKLDFCLIMLIVFDIITVVL